MLTRRRTSLPGLAATLFSATATIATASSTAFAQPAPSPSTTAPSTAPAPSASGATAPAAPPTAAAPAAPPTGTAPERAPLVEEKPMPKGGEAPPPAATDKPDPAAPRSTAIGGKPSDVYADEWWSHARPMLELHGYYRVRAELFHNFALGRADETTDSLWNHPIEKSYTDRRGNIRNVGLCYSDALNTKSGNYNCDNKTQSGANMRLRLDPEIHISDNLRIVTQVDLLDNLVLGSTPANRYYTTGANGAENGASNPYVPLGGFATTQDVPSAGQNGFADSIRVKRAYGEYTSPVGVLRFGRMANQWGLGILANAGDGFDSDWQSNVDRIMFITGIKSLDLYFAGAWDFPNEGATSAAANERQGQPYDLGQLDDVNQYVLTVVRRVNPDIAKQQLARGKVVLDGGLFAVYRSQYLSNDLDGNKGQVPGQGTDNLRESLGRRNAQAFIPDLWAKIRYKKFRFEVEALTVQGTIDSTLRDGGQASDYASTQPGVPNGWKLRQYLVATQMEYKAVEDKLKVQFGFGWASGDPDIGTDGSPLSLSPKGSGLQPQQTQDRTFSMARFHPDYRVDLILFRNILTRVQGAYYFRPSVDYDFIRNTNGQKVGGGAAVIWSRASEFVQAPGHKRDLGVELDLSVYYQAKDGSLNDNPDKMGGFYTMIQYGVLFPLGGLGYMDGQKQQAVLNGVALDTSAAQTLRWYMGIMF